METVHSIAKKLGMDTVAETTGELIQLLQKVPDNTKLRVAGADLGGYDISYQPYVYLHDDKGVCVLRHLECDAWEAVERGVLTYEESKLLGQTI